MYRNKSFLRFATNLEKSQSLLFNVFGDDGQTVSGVIAGGTGDVPNYIPNSNTQPLTLARDIGESKTGSQIGMRTGYIS